MDIVEEVRNHEFMEQQQHDIFGTNSDREQRVMLADPIPICLPLRRHGVGIYSILQLLIRYDTAYSYSSRKRSKIESILPNPLSHLPKHCSLAKRTYGSLSGRRTNVYGVKLHL